MRLVKGGEVLGVECSINTVVRDVSLGAHSGLKLVRGFEKRAKCSCVLSRCVGWRYREHKVNVKKNEE